MYDIYDYKWNRAVARVTWNLILHTSIGKNLLKTAFLPGTYFSVIFVLIYIKIKLKNLVIWKIMDSIFLDLSEKCQKNRTDDKMLKFTEHCFRYYEKCIFFMF